MTEHLVEAGAKMSDYDILLLLKDAWEESDQRQLSQRERDAVNEYLDDHIQEASNG